MVPRGGEKANSHSLIDYLYIPTFRAISRIIQLLHLHFNYKNFYNAFQPAIALAEWGACSGVLETVGILS